LSFTHQPALLSSASIRSSWVITARCSAGQCIAESIILQSQCYHICRPSFSIGATTWRLHWACHSPQRANGQCRPPSEAYAGHLREGGHGTTSGTQKFPFAASAKINSSSVRFETAFLNRLFSFCSRFSRSIEPQGRLPCVVSRNGKPPEVGAYLVFEVDQLKTISIAFSRPECKVSGRETMKGLKRDDVVHLGRHLDQATRQDAN